MKHTVTLTMRVEALTPDAAEELGLAAGYHLLDTFNDDQSIDIDEGILSTVNPPQVAILRLAIRTALALLEDPEAEAADADRVTGQLRAALDGTEAPTVWLASYDVRNGGEGVEVFYSQRAAIAAVIGWVTETDPDGSTLLSRSEMTEEEARNSLTEKDWLRFGDADCYYNVSEQEVQP